MVRHSGFGLAPALPPVTTAMGALLNHITGGAEAETFQPMNVNFGLFPPLEGRYRGRERKRAMSRRALADLDQWLGALPAEEGLHGGASLRLSSTKIVNAFFHLHPEDMKKITYLFIVPILFIIINPMRVNNNADFVDNLIRTNVRKI